jgi:hypothetical protein
VTSSVARRWIELPQDRVQWPTLCLGIEPFPAARCGGRSSYIGAIVRSAGIVLKQCKGHCRGGGGACIGIVVTGGFIIYIVSRHWVVYGPISLYSCAAGADIMSNDLYVCCMLLLGPPFFAVCLMFLHYCYESMGGDSKPYARCAPRIIHTFTVIVFLPEGPNNCSVCLQ